MKELEFNAKNLYDVAMSARDEMKLRLAHETADAIRYARAQIAMAARDGNTSTVLDFNFLELTNGEMACVKTGVSQNLRTCGLLTFKGDNFSEMLVKWGKEAQK